MKILLICCFAAATFGELAWGACPTEMASSPEMVACFTADLVFANSLSEAETNETMSLMCTPSGRQYVKCIMPVVEACPGLLNLDDMVGSMLKDSGLSVNDMFGLSCELQKEGCRDIMKCFDTGAPMRKKRGATTPVNAFLRFQAEAVAVCAEGSQTKTMMMCVNDKGQYCDQTLLPKLEQVGIAMQPNVTTDMVPFKGISKALAFVKEMCDKIPAKFTTTTCVRGKVTELEQCTNNIKQMYPNLDNCGVKPLSLKCISDHIQPACGEEIAKFYEDNIGYIFEKVPSDCDTSAAPVLTMSSMVLVFLLAILFS